MLLVPDQILNTEGIQSRRRLLKKTHKSWFTIVNCHWFWEVTAVTLSLRTVCINFMTRNFRTQSEASYGDWHTRETSWGGGRGGLSEQDPFTEMPWIFWNHLRWRSKMKNAELIGIIYDISDGLTSHNLFIYIYTWNAVIAYFFRLLWASSLFLWNFPILMDKIAYFEVLGRCLHFKKLWYSDDYSDDILMILKWVLDKLSLNFLVFLSETLVLLPTAKPGVHWVPKGGGGAAEVQYCIPWSMDVDMDVYGILCNYPPNLMVFWVVFLIEIAIWRYILWYISFFPSDSPHFQTHPSCIKPRNLSTFVSHLIWKVFFGHQWRIRRSMGWRNQGWTGVIGWRQHVQVIDTNSLHWHR